MQIKDDDADFARRAQPIGDCPTGSVIEATKTLEDPDEPGTVVLTAGRRYSVTEMRPLRPSLVVKDDTGVDCVIDDKFIANFRRVFGATQ